MLAAAAAALACHGPYGSQVQSGAGGALSASGAVGVTGGSGTADGGAAIGGGVGGGGLSNDGGNSSTSAGAGGVAPVGGMNGMGGSAGSGDGNCPFPTSFKWSSTGPLVEPKSPLGHDFVSLKDFTITKSGDQFVVYATVFDASSSWSGVNFNFTDWSQIGSAPQRFMGNMPTGGTVAPTLFYFTPKHLWVLTYQWGFQYATASDPADPSTWSSPNTLLTGGPLTALDQTVICDSMNCYLFFAGDDGNIYRSSMPIGNFPGPFSGSTTILTDSKSKLFEAVQVYTVKGTGMYLMIVEAIGGAGRYFRAFSATKLDGTFTAVPGASTEATPFAGKSNVDFAAGAWTNDISHGDIVRDDPSETQTVDPCNMQFLYQGSDKTASSSSYQMIPYRPALLTKTN